MSYRPPYQPQQFSQFRQTLTFEEIVKNQISKCLEAKNSDDGIVYRSSVRGLVGLVTPKMSDEIYICAMKGLETGWQVKLKANQKAFQSNLRKAHSGCPDLVPRPSVSPDEQYWEDAFGICLALFERRGLLMKFSVEDPL